MNKLRDPLNIFDNIYKQCTDHLYKYLIFVRLIPKASIMKQGMADQTYVF